MTMIIAALAQAVALDPPSATALNYVQAGGVLAFAGAVWYELRTQRAERSAAEARSNAALTAMQVGLAELTAAIRERRPNTAGM